MTPIFNEVLGWIQRETPNAIGRAQELLYECLRSFQPFMEVVNTAITRDVRKALRLLRRIRTEVTRFCRRNRYLMTKLTKLALTTTAREVVIRGGVKQAIKYGVAEAGQQVVQRAMKIANPASLVADLAQTGLEIAGHEEVAKGVGVSGNVITGAVSGAMIGGPVGFAVGALGGFLTWGVGEVTSEVVKSMLS